MLLKTNWKSILCFFIFRNRTPLPSPHTPVQNLGAATTDSIVDGSVAANRSRRAGSGARATAPAPSEPKTNGHFAEQIFGGESGGGVRYRAPSQEVTHIGTIPKRTESLYLKHSVTTDSKATVSLCLSVKKPFNYYKNFSSERQASVVINKKRVFY